MLATRVHSCTLVRVLILVARVRERARVRVLILLVCVLGMRVLTLTASVHKSTDGGVLTPAASVREYTSMNRGCLRR